MGQTISYIDTESVKSFRLATAIVFVLGYAVIVVCEFNMRNMRDNGNGYEVSKRLDISPAREGKHDVR